MNEDADNRILILGNVKLKHAAVIAVLAPTVLIPKDSVPKSGANPLTDHGGRPHAS
jgi:hypothetical protein